MGEPLPCPTDFLVRVVGTRRTQRAHGGDSNNGLCSRDRKATCTQVQRGQRSQSGQEERNRQPKFLKVLGGSGFFWGGAQSLSLSDTRHLD